MKMVDGVVKIGGAAIDVNEVAVIQDDGGAGTLVVTKGGTTVVVKASFAETCKALDFAEGDDGGDDADDGE